MCSQAVPYVLHHHHLSMSISPFQYQQADSVCLQLFLLILCIPWVHFAPINSTQDVFVQMLRRHKERSWNAIGIVAISCIHITLDILHYSIEIGIWARQECIQNVAPVGLSIIRMSIFDYGLKMAVY